MEEEMTTIQVSGKPVFEPTEQSTRTLIEFFGDGPVSAWLAKRMSAHTVQEMFLATLPTSVHIFSPVHLAIGEMEIALVWSGHEWSDQHEPHLYAVRQSIWVAPFTLD
jgi:hypothetical protein